MADQGLGYILRKPAQLPIYYIEEKISLPGRSNKLTAGYDPGGELAALLFMPKCPAWDRPDMIHPYSP